MGQFNNAGVLQPQGWEFNHQFFDRIDRFL